MNTVIHTSLNININIHTTHRTTQLVGSAEMTMYVHWTCIDINRKDVHA